MKKRTLLFALMIVVLSVTPVMAQGDSPELKIRLNRDFGYGGFDNKIQGRFSIRVSDAEEFEQVDFYMDDVLLESVSEEPFRVQFRTENYGDGPHQIFAIGLTADGQEIRSNEIVRVFISPEDVRQSMGGLVLPIIGIIVLAALVSTFLPRLLWGKKGVILGEYGMAGGSVCKKCGKPFSRHVWAPNMIAGKLESCPHCRKWQIASRATPDQLEAAEKLVFDDGGSSMQASGGESEEDRLDRQIDDSRYDE